MLVAVGVIVWLIGQIWDLNWHAANPGVPGYDPAHALWYLGIALALTGIGWWSATFVRRVRAR